MALSEPADHLSTAQVARLLGVKQETVYAYVSRGLLPRRRLPGRPGSWFPADLVEQLRSGRRNDLAGLAERIRTRVTLIESGRLSYRGVDAVELAKSGSYEQVCALLWRSAPVTFADLQPDAALRSVIGSMRRRTDIIRTAVCVLAGSTALRGDLTESAVVTAAARAFGAALSALPLLGAPAEPGSTAAQRLWPAIADRRPTNRSLALLDAALILLADHELAGSTTAARVAASTRANIHGVLLTALGAMDSPVHGGAASAARAMLVSARADPDGVIDRYLADDQRPPGFGHLIYTESDPRADHLLDRLSVMPRISRRLLTVVEQLRSSWGERRGWFANSDFALAVMGEAFEMAPDAGDTIFTLARFAGWTAHAMEEYSEPPMRFRLHGLYTGDRP